MRFINGARRAPSPLEGEGARGLRRPRGQRGVSLIEAVVASALMGIGLVAGLTAWDTASMSAARAVRLAWANCIVRSEMDAVLASPFYGYYLTPFDADQTVKVLVAPVPGRAGAGPGQEQLLTVQAFDPQSRALLAQVSALKVSALQGRKDVNAQPGVRSDVMLGCPAR